MPLLSLNNLSDPDQTLPSGQTIRGRLQVILEQVYITTCVVPKC